VSRSIVYLVGAGPGHPGLITARGLECLAAADVVLYDRLVHPRLLRHARPDAEKIDVGVAAPQPIEQEAICYLIAEKAREGKVVARLKWGDPFIFDYGGTEALFLHEQGLRFEVVPGIPAGIGAASYAGVPLTYPGGGDTLTFVRGHEDEGKDEGKTRHAVDWASLARLDGTIVCYAGPDQLPHILQSLVAHGRSKDDAAALIYDGTLTTQRTVHGTLAEIAAAVPDTHHRRAAILVVGRVAALREHLRWFDTRPLFGRRVLVTRPREQAAELVALLESHGAEAIEAPMIRIAAPDDYGPLDAACARIRDYDWVIFASANAVDVFIKRLLATPFDLRALSEVKLCAVGPATADRLSELGLKVDLVPAEHRAEALVDALAGRANPRGLRVLLPRADIGREIIAEELRRHGAEVTEVVAYRTLTVDPEREGGLDIYRMLLDRRIDVVTFTSASSVRNLVRVLGVEPAADLLGSIVVASIGPVTAEAAAQYNIQSTVIPSEYTIPGLVDAIVDHFARAQHPAPAEP
jgi:uroporphyrinogen III methyltransferase / synthase